MLILVVVVVVVVDGKADLPVWWRLAWKLIELLDKWPMNLNIEELRCC